MNFGYVTVNGVNSNDLSSDAGLLLIKEFVSKLGIDKLFVKSFKTNDSALFRYHTDQENLLQMIYMIIAGYFEDDASDELTNNPVFKSVLEKDALASQPTVSRFFNPTVLQQHMFGCSLKAFSLMAYRLFLFFTFVIFYWIYIDIYSIIVIFRGDYYAFKKNKN